LNFSFIGLEGHWTSCFKRAMCISCRRQVELWTSTRWGFGSCGRTWTGGSKTWFSCGRHKWM